MSLEKKLKNLKFDTRLQEWGLKTGAVNKEDLKKHLESLEDVSNNAIPLTLEEESQHH